MYRRYWLMRQRCYLPSNDQYNNYGARGIKVCPQWLGVDGFTQFKKDMGDCPEGWSLDRIDVNGNYCPENCRWASPITQRINRRDYKSDHPGVYYNKSRHKWEARLKIKGKFILCKKFDTLEEAIEARKRAEEEYKDWIYGKDQITTL